MFTGSKGTYMDHTHLLWNEALNTLGFPVDIPTGLPTGLPTGGHSEVISRPRESSGEMECRRVAEMLTGRPFPKKRPDFLRNSVTDANLEIDCYCDELKIGIEYNGKQHYHYTPYFHSSKDAFYTTKYRDEMKARLCKENGVNLIIVPYTVDIKDIEEYLKQKL